VLSLTFRPHYHKGNTPQYPLGRGLGGLQTQSGSGGEEINISVPAGNRIPVAQPDTD
jgi:hypothetical protein